uniref:PPM-type phosphatase domain-containing protein n=1 Tax=Stegastes partitus TaxID=144197 RepID=A0A3B4Z1Q9_9TELE
MSSAMLLNLLRCHRSTIQENSGSILLLLRVVTLQVGGASFSVWAMRQASRSAPYDSNSSGRPQIWDSFGIWDKWIEEPILLPSSIRYGKPIPLSRVDSASVLGLRKQNEDCLRVTRIHDNLLYFAVFDGHGGPHAADCCYTFMEKFIKSEALDTRFYTKPFLDVDKALLTRLSCSNNGEIW